jgi:hypothetical protein
MSKYVIFIISEMSSRYWTYLFENLERSISEIYEGCEKEENIRQCKVSKIRNLYFKNNSCINLVMFFFTIIGSRHNIRKLHP